jgi:hypothetical protein
MSLAVRPVVDVDHTGRWFQRGLVGTNPAQHGLAATRQTLAGELAGAGCATQCQAGVTLGLAHPGGGVGIRTGHRRHPFGAGPLATGRGIAKKALDMEVKVYQGCGPRGEPLGSGGSDYGGGWPAAHRWDMGRSGW